MLSVGVLAGSAGAQAGDMKSDWPQFRGPGGRGISGDKGVPLTWSKSDNVAWKAELPGPGTSSPIVIGSRLFVTCFTGYGSNPAIAGGRLYIRSEQFLYCLGRK